MSLELIRLSNKFDRCWADLPALRRAIEEAGVQFNQRTSATLIDRAGSPGGTRTVSVNSLVR